MYPEADKTMTRTDRAKVRIRFLGFLAFGCSGPAPPGGAPAPPPVTPLENGTPAAAAPTLEVVALAPLPPIGTPRSSWTVCWA